MKRPVLFVCIFMLSFLAFSEVQSRPKTQFYTMATFVAAYNPSADMIDFDYPYVFPMLSSCFSHRFTDSEAINALSFNLNGTLAPIWLSAAACFDYTPLPFCTLSLGAESGTSWNFALGDLEVNSIGVYNPSVAEYDDVTPFTHWLYSFFVQARFSYDIGKLLSSEKHSLTVSAVYKASYTALSGVENGVMWKEMFSCEQVNGFRYNAMLNLSYKVPNPYLRAVSFTASADGYFSESYFDDEYESYDKTFMNIKLAPTLSGGIGYKDVFTLSFPFSARRKYDENTGEDEKDYKPLLKSDGREWTWNGVMLTYTHIF